MKKVKLFLSICAMCLGISVFCLGVYAAQTVTYTIGGTISYTVVDVFAKINTSIFKVKGQTTAGDMNSNISTLATITLSSINGSSTTSDSTLKYELAKTLNEIDTSESLDTATYEQSFGDLVFEKDSSGVGYYTYYIVINIQNFVADKTINAKLTDKTETYMNIAKSCKLFQADISKGETKNIVMAISLADKTIEINSIKLNYLIEVGYDVEQDPITDYTFEILTEPSGDTKGSAKITKYTGTDSVVTTPSTVNLVQTPEHDAIWEFENGTQLVNSLSAGLYDTLMKFTFCEYTLGKSESQTVKTMNDAFTVLFGSDWASKEDSLDPSTVKDIKIDSTSFECVLSEKTEKDDNLNLSLPEMFFGKIGQILYKGGTCILKLNNDGTENGKKLTIDDLDKLTELKNNITDNYFPMKVTDVMIPGEIVAYQGDDYIVTCVGDSAFSSASNVTYVIISEGVTSMGEYSFGSAENLVYIRLPATLNTIGTNSFNGCSSLKSIEFTNTTGWYYTSSSDYTSGMAIDVTNKTSNATYFTSTYINNYWYRKTT